MANNHVSFAPEVSTITSIEPSTVLNELSFMEQQ